MKKKAVIILALMLILSSLAGCSSSDQKDMEAFEERYQKNQKLSEEERQAQFDQRVQENLEMLQGENPQEEKPQETPPEPAPQPQQPAPPSEQECREKIDLIWNGYTTQYPTITYGQALEAFYMEPAWQYIGNNQVVFTGNGQYEGGVVPTEISFTLLLEEDTFRVEYLKEDDELQGEDRIMELLQTVFHDADCHGMGISPEFNFNGDWISEDGKYDLIVSNNGAGEYYFDVEEYGFNPETETSKHWVLTSTEYLLDEVEISRAYQGFYLEMYLRPNGTVGGNAAPAGDCMGKFVLMEEGRVMRWVPGTDEAEETYFTRTAH